MSSDLRCLDINIYSTSTSDKLPRLRSCKRYRSAHAISHIHNVRFTVSTLNIYCPLLGGCYVYSSKLHSEW